MNLLFHLLHSTQAPSTHQKLALDALTEMKGVGARRWACLFLKHHGRYLAGAIDPDIRLKDFDNHVLYVERNNWGGAAQEARHWYGDLVEALRRRQWAEAVYAAGVLSHYYTDPLMPFHTSQSADANHIQRAVEWSIARAYDELRAMHEESERELRVRVPRQADWLEQMVIRGATRAHRHYQELLEHYDIHSGVIDPPSGLDGPCMRFLTDLLGHATVGLARILERAFAEAGVKPPATPLTVETLAATMQLPICWAGLRLAEARERKQIEAMYEEWLDSGRVEQTLPVEVRQIRAAAAGDSSGERRASKGAVERVHARQAAEPDADLDDEREDFEDEEQAEVTPAKPSLWSRWGTMPSFLRRPESVAPPAGASADEADSEETPPDEEELEDEQEYDEYEVDEEEYRDEAA